MKHIILLSIIALVAGNPQNVSGQQNTTSFEVDGIKVIHKQLPNEVVAVRLYIRGGTANYSADQQGIEALAYEMALFGGTENRSSEDIYHQTRDLGIGLSGRTGYDYGYLGMTALKMFWDESWELWSESIMHPEMSEGAFNAFRDELYARNRRINNAPEERIEALSLSSAFSNTDYAVNPNGTEESLFDLTVEDVRNHYQKILTKANCFIVVVGDISRADLEGKVAAAFGTLPDGQARELTPPQTAKNPGATIEHMDLDVNHIQARMPAPPQWSEESTANDLAMNLLTDRLVNTLAIEQQIAYAPAAISGEEQRHPSNSVYAATISPVKTAELTAEQIRQAKAEGFSAEELKSKKASYLTLHYLAQETVDAQAHVLGDAEIQGDWQKVKDITSEVKNLSAEEVNRVFNKYSTWIHWTYLGNASQVETGDFPFINGTANED